MISTAISPSMRKDTGLAFILILLLTYLKTSSRPLILGAAAVAVAVILAPTLFHWPAKLWFGLAELLGTFMPKVFLTLIYFLVVTPVGLARRVFGADPLALKLWKQGGGSVFTAAEKTYQPRDITSPY